MQLQSRGNSVKQSYSVMASKAKIRTNAINVSIVVCFQIPPKSSQFLLFSESSISIYVSSVRTFFPVFPAIGSNRQPKVFFRACRKPDWSSFKLVEFDLKVFLPIWSILSFFSIQDAQTSIGLFNENQLLCTSMRRDLIKDALL